jgi:hypothetical protein
MARSTNQSKSSKGFDGISVGAENDGGDYN